MTISPDDFLLNCNIFGIPTGKGSSGSVTEQQVQRGAFNTATATGLNDAFVVTLSPVPAALTDGMLITMDSGSLVNLTSSPTLKVNTFAAKPIVTFAGAPAPGDIQTGSEYIFVYNLANDHFQLINPSTSTADTFQVQSSGYSYALDTGVANAYIANILPAQLTTQSGLQVIMTAIHSNSGASTLTVNGATHPIVLSNGSALTGGEILVNGIYQFFYSAALTSYVFMNPSSGIISGSVATKVQVQRSSYNIGIDTGSGDSYVVNLTPAVTELTDGLIVMFVALNFNSTINPTLNVNSIGDTPIVLASLNPVFPGDISPSQINICQYSLANSCFFILNGTVSTFDMNLFQGGQYTSGNDTGSVNAYNYVPHYNNGVFNALAGTMIVFSPLNTNTTTTPTVTTPGNSAVPIKMLNGSSVPAGSLLANNIAVLIYTQRSAGTAYYGLLNSGSNSGMITNPPVSASSSLAVGTAYQNTLGYDVVITVYLSVTSATSASLLLGIGTSTTPTQQTIVSGFTTAVTHIIPITIYLPTGYYAKLSTSGTISQTISGQQTMPV